MADDTTCLHLRSAQTGLGVCFQAKMPELTISSEDAAEVILDNLSKSGRFSRRRVGVALPPGLRKYKDDLPR
jgi:hypothetical protein